MAENLVKHFANVKFVLSAHKPTDFPTDSGRETAFAGRSNSGKSSAINAITNHRGLARTSKTPGRTQLVNFFSLDPARRLVDLPGYGFAKVPPRIRAHWRELMSAYFEQRSSLRGLMLIMDVRRPLTEFDWQMLTWAEARQCPVHVLLTKADKLSRGAGGNTLLKVRKELSELELPVEVQLFSALRHTGVDEARAALLALLPQ